MHWYYIVAVAIGSMIFGLSVGLWLLSKVFAAISEAVLRGLGW